VQRHGRGGRFSASRIRAAGVLLLAAYCLFVGWLTLRPRSVPWVPPANLEPFTTIRAELADGPMTALTGIGGDLLLLAPLGVLLPIATGRLHRPLPGTAMRVLPAGVLTASALAVVQSGVPGHVVDVDTVLLHSAGCALTHLLLFPPLRARLGRRRPRRGPPLLREDAADAEPPRSPRVGFAP
jgi:hypothetical protein